jgi:hypothetical protein
MPAASVKRFTTRATSISAIRFAVSLLAAVECAELGLPNAVSRGARNSCRPCAS